MNSPNPTRREILKYLSMAPFAGLAAPVVAAPVVRSIPPFVLKVSHESTCKFIQELQRAGDIAAQMNREIDRLLAHVKTLPCQRSNTC